MKLKALHLPKLRIVNKVPDIIELIIDSVLLFIDRKTISNEN